MRERLLGPDHPFVAESLNNRAILRIEQVRGGRGGMVYDSSCPVILFFFLYGMRLEISPLPSYHTYTSYVISIKMSANN